MPLGFVNESGLNPNPVPEKGRPLITNRLPSSGSDPPRGSIVRIRSAAVGAAGVWALGAAGVFCDADGAGVGAAVAAVEFSFLLGVLTLGAATTYDALKNGQNLFNTYGVLDPAIGFVVAFVAAFFAVRWMIGYLNRHGIAIFGWYRIVVGIVALVLIATGVL